MNILGVNAYHPDSAACLIKNGELIAAVEEERLNRIKHWAGFPTESIKFCLEKGSLKIEDIDFIAVNRDPKKNLIKKFFFAILKRPSFNFLFERIVNRKKLTSLPQEFEKIFGKNIKNKIVYVEHHIAHLASSYYVSGFQDAALISVDGFGDFASVMTALGQNHQIKPLSEINFPHSLGLFYTAMTQFLGYPFYGEEYKVMGLASYGEPVFLDKMREIVLLGDNGTFSLNLDYFQHHTKGASLSWNNGSPDMGTVYTEKWESLLGIPVRGSKEEIQDVHKNIASSAQKMYEEALFHILKHLYDKTQNKRLCLAGGCGYNSVANGKIFENTPFKELFVQSAAGDSGGAIGAAFYTYYQKSGSPKSFKMRHSYWGPAYTQEEIDHCIQGNVPELEKISYSILTCEQDQKICEVVAELLESGNVIGWFQGAAEWGPRALGNRSILVDPRRKDMKQLLNSKIKKRESYRPFAPSIKREAVKEYFETDYDVPFMLQVYRVKQDKREVIPAVTHVDGTGRLQTVEKEINSIYWTLIDEFEKRTGVPVLLNTSFNENEPVVNTPQEALNCFLRTKMDVLVLGRTIIQRQA